MPLLDHFRPPLSVDRHRESFHTTWAGSIADRLNERLPDGFFAEEQVHPAARVEIGVAAFEQTGRTPRPDRGPALAEVETWSPPAPARSVPAAFTDAFEVLAFRSEGGPTLVAAVELVSPSNKDRPEHRRAFAVKCAAYLTQGVSLAVIDVVTSRRADLHAELLALTGSGPADDLAGGPLFAAAYRPVRRGGDGRIDLWPHPVAVGGPLPTLPLFLGPDLAAPLELEPTYAAACRRRRIEG